jgi:predicted transposase/invertase (TIGR01784 family)
MTEDKNVDLSGNGPYTDGMATRISAMLDIVFKYILGSKDSTKLLTSFINAVQRDSGFPEIETVSIENPFNDKTYQDDKISIIDVRAADRQGNVYNVEVQLQTQPYFAERSLYYWAKTYADQLKEGNENETLNKVIGINVLNFNLFPEHISYHSCFLLHEKDNKDYVLTLDLVLHYLETRKLDAKPDTELKKWLYFLRHAGEEDERMKVLLETNEIFHDAAERYTRFTEDKRARMAATARSMFLHDQATRLSVARKESLAEGRAEGIKEKAQETARKLLKEGMEIDFIVRITGLSEEEIRSL